MAIIEQIFNDILGAERKLSEIMDETKSWVEKARYAGLTTVSDWVEGGMNYLLWYVASLFKYDLELYGDELIQLCFPATSTGEFLDKLYARNGVYRLDGNYATITVRFDLLEDLDFDVVVDAGTEVGTDEAITYYVLEDTIIDKDSKVAYTLVRCTDLGTLGNVKAGTILNIFTELGFECKVINEKDVTNGKDNESDEDFKARAKDLANSVAVGTDLWFEKLALTLVDDALAYELDKKTILLIYKPTTGVNKSDLIQFFDRKDNRTDKNVIVQEAEPVAVINNDMNITLLIKNNKMANNIIKQAEQKIQYYVDKKIKLGSTFKVLCIKQLCESIEGVLYCDLTGYSNLKLSEQQYATIEKLNIKSEIGD